MLNDRHVARPLYFPFQNQRVADRVSLLGYWRSSPPCVPRSGLGDVPSSASGDGVRPNSLSLAGVDRVPRSRAAGRYGPSVICPLFHAASRGAVPAPPHHPRAHCWIAPQGSSPSYGVPSRGSVTGSRPSSGAAIARSPTASRRHQYTCFLPQARLRPSQHAVAWTHGGGSPAGP